MKRTARSRACVRADAAPGPHRAKGGGEERKGWDGERLASTRTPSYVRADAAQGPYMAKEGGEERRGARQNLR